MGRAYAGILGPLAFAISIARGVAAGSGVEGTLLAAMASLFAFAATHRKMSAVPTIGARPTTFSHHAAENFRACSAFTSFISVRMYAWLESGRIRGVPPCCSDFHIKPLAIQPMKGT